MEYKINFHDVKDGFIVYENPSKELQKKLLIGSPFTRHS